MSEATRAKYKELELRISKCLGDLRRTIEHLMRAESDLASTMTPCFKNLELIQKLADAEDPFNTERVVGEMLAIRHALINRLRSRSSSISTDPNYLNERDCGNLTTRRQPIRLDESQI